MQVIDTVLYSVCIVVACVHVCIVDLQCAVALLRSYNLESGIWNTVPINSGPLPRYGHSLAAYQVNRCTYSPASVSTSRMQETTTVLLKGNAIETSLFTFGEQKGKSS